MLYENLELFHLLGFQFSKLIFLQLHPFMSGFSEWSFILITWDYCFFYKIHKTLLVVCWSSFDIQERQLFDCNFCDKTVDFFPPYLQNLVNY